jgi:hypothetical protein
MTEALPWLVPVAVAAVAAGLAVLRARKPAALALAGGAVPARPVRRTWLVRGVLGAALVALLAVSVALLGKQDRFGTLVGGGRSTVVVLDLSASVSDLVYQEIARTLSGIVAEADDSSRVGLVVFSDVAEEALPPGTRVAELRPFIRFFQPKHEPSASRKPSYYRAAGPTAAPPTAYPLNPWFRKFSGGTRISTGLETARLALERDGYDGGRVLLLSDLAESQDDLPRLTAELARYASDPGLELRIVALPPATRAETGFFELILGSPGAVVASTELASAQRADGTPVGPFPTWLAVAVGLLAAALAVHELVARPLAWDRRAGTGVETP